MDAPCNTKDNAVKKYYTVHKELGHMVSGKWYDSVCYRIVVHHKGNLDTSWRTKTLRAWPKTEDDAWREIARMMRWDNEDIRRIAEREMCRVESCTNDALIDGICPTHHERGEDHNASL